MWSLESLGQTCYWLNRDGPEPIPRLFWSHLALTRDQWFTTHSPHSFFKWTPLIGPNSGLSCHTAGGGASQDLSFRKRPYWNITCVFSLLWKGVKDNQCVTVRSGSCLKRGVCNKKNFKKHIYIYTVCEEKSLKIEISQISYCNRNHLDFF